MTRVLPVLVAGLALYSTTLAVYLLRSWARAGFSLAGLWQTATRPPNLQSEDDQRLARMLASMLREAFIVTVLLTPLAWLLAPSPTAGLLVVLGGWLSTALLGQYTLLWSGHARWAGRLYPFTIFAIVTLAILLGGSVQDAAAGAYVIVIISSGLLLGARAAVLTGAACIAMVLGLYLVQTAGGVSPLADAGDLASHSIIRIAIFAFSASLLRQAAIRIDEALAEARRLRFAASENSRSLERLLAAERKRARQTELLNEFAQTMTALSGPDIASGEAVRRLGESFGFEAAAVYLVEGETLTPRSAHGLLAHRPAAAEALAAEHGAAGWAARHNQTCWITDARTDARYAALPGVDLACLVAVPMRLGRIIVGVLLVGSTRLESFDATDVRTLETLAEMLVAALQTGRLLGQLRRRQQMTEAVRRIGAAVNASLDLSTVLSAICTETGAAFEADRVEVWLESGSAQPLQRAAAVGNAASAHTTAGDGSAAAADQLARALADGRLLYHTNQIASPAWGPALPEFADARSLLVAPLRKDGRAFGALVIGEWTRAAPYALEDASAADLLSGPVAAAVDNARHYGAHRRRADDLALINDITRTALEFSDLDQLLQALADRLGALIGADGCYLALWDETQRTARPAAASQALRASYLELQPGPPPGNQSLTEAALAAGQAVPVLDVLASPYFQPEVAAKFPTRSILGVPLMVGGQWLGAALIGFDELHVFTADEIAVAEQAGRQIALALARALALAEARRRHTELEALRQASLQVTSSLDLRAVLESILRETLTLAEAHDAHIFLHDNGQLTFAAALWASVEQPTPFTSVRPGGLTDTVARSGERLVVPNVNEHPLYANWRWGGAIVGLPLRIGSETRGVMNVAFERPRYFDEHALRVLGLLADQAAIALENARLFEAEREQRALNETLREASVSLTASLDFETVLNGLLSRLEAVVPYDGASVMLIEAGQAWVARQRGYDQFGEPAVADLVRKRFEVATTPHLARMVASRQPLIIADIAAEPGWVRLEAVSDFRSWVGVPVTVQGEVLACFTIANHQPAYYTEAHAARLAIFASQAALALQNARLFAAQQRRSEEQRLLLAAARDLSAGLSQEAVLAAAARHMTVALHSAGCIVSLWERDHDRVVTLLDYARRKNARVDEAGTTYALSDYPLTRRVLEERLCVITYVNDPAADPAEVGLLRSFGHTTCLMVPLFTGERVLGLIEVLRDAGEPLFNDGDLQLAQSLAAQAAVALENSRLHAEVLRLAVTDSLTGLANPRAFEQSLATEFHRAERYGHSLSLVIMDIDNFKRYNDAYGHPAGNERLKAIADIVRTNVRDPDLPVRYGGEEFALLLPHTDKAGALALAERIRLAAESAAPDQLPRGRPLPGYSLSLGVASFPTDALSAEALILAADNAELAAKRSGKNRVVAAAPLAASHRVN